MGARRWTLLLTAFYLIYFAGNGPQNKIATVKYWTSIGLDQCDHYDHGPLEPCADAEESFNKAYFAYFTGDMVLGGLSGLVLDAAGPKITAFVGCLALLVSYFGMLPGSLLGLRSAMVLHGASIQAIVNSLVSIANLFSKPNTLIGLMMGFCEVGSSLFIVVNSLVFLGLNAVASIHVLMLNCVLSGALVLYMIPSDPFPNADIDSENARLLQEARLEAPVSIDDETATLTVGECVKSPDYLLFLAFWLVITLTVNLYNGTVDAVFRVSGHVKTLSPIYENLLPLSMVFGVGQATLIDRIGCLPVAVWLTTLVLTTCLSVLSSNLWVQLVGCICILLVKGSVFTVIVAYLNDKFPARFFGSLMAFASVTAGLVSFFLTDALTAYVARGDDHRWRGVFKAASFLLCGCYGLLLILINRIPS
ncbi:MAG: hypothetical protein KVP17_004299 [Porospora cf. gigantea B]|uniref:uncharacterized protein n=1 Tax=Porospora cf. gigantea B TaxID=2853592 RepID=UPI003571BF6E|nr:MAG: hypothetical protein KVP17_004299 [Porospora cf. gigantea B]